MTPAPTKPRCSAPVNRAGSYRAYRCGNLAKVARDGKLFCGIHDPVAVLEKHTRKTEAHNARVAAIAESRALSAAQREEAARRSASFDPLVLALRWHVDALDLGDVGFFERHGFNVAEVFPKTRELLASLEAK